MSERNDTARDRYGMRFDQPVYRDGVFLILDKNTNNSLIVSTNGFLTKAAFDALKPVGNQIQTANVTSGMVDMAAGDGLELSFGGTIAGTVNYSVLAYDPCFLSTDTGKQTISGYFERVILTGVATLSASVIGAAGAAALGGGTLATDLYADAITVLNSGAQLAATKLDNVENVTITPAASSPATIRVGARGARFLRVLTDLAATSTSAYAWGKRIQGGGVGAMR